MINKYTATNNHYERNGKDYPNRIVSVRAKDLHEAREKIINWYSSDPRFTPYLRLWIDNGCSIFINDDTTNILQRPLVCPQKHED